MKGIMYKAERLAAEESVMAGHRKFNPEESILCVCLQHHRQISSTNEQVRYLLRSSDELRPLHL